MTVKDLKIEQELDALDEYFLDFSQRAKEIEETITSLDTLLSESGALLEVRDHFVYLGEYASDYNIYPLVEPINIIVRFVEASAKQQNPLCETSRDVLLLLLDRLFTMAKEAANSGKIPFLVFAETEEALRYLALENGTSSDHSHLKNTIRILTGQQENPSVDSIDHSNMLFELDEDEKQLVGCVDSSCKLGLADKLNDLVVFKSLSMMLDKRHKHWCKRTATLLDLAIQMNANAGYPVDVDQLKAAVFIHDITMLQLPDSMFYKNNKYNTDERISIERHPNDAFMLLNDMPGWNDAAQIVRQHHEAADGTGYPDNLAEDNICDGAMIIAICDTFFSVTNLRDDRYSRKDALRAAGEINAFRGSQFSSKWVRIFNRVQHANLLAADKLSLDTTSAEKSDSDQYIDIDASTNSIDLNQHKDMGTRIESSWIAHDLAFFHKLAKLNDCRNKHWHKRCDFILQLALGMNANGNNIVAIEQLQAAVYVHDVAMLELPDAIIFKTCKYEASELALVKRHAYDAAAILKQRKGWTGAAEIVHQHHERIDGNGYPEGISNKNICDGSKIIAICDAYYSMTHNRTDRNGQLEVIEAIGEINACNGTQFAPNWVKVFNQTTHIYPDNWQIKLRPFLKKSRYFADAPENALNTLITKLKPLVYADGECILKQGQYNDRIFFLFSGAVGIYVNGTYLIDMNRKGDLFGEMSVISRKPASADVIAKGRVKTFTLQVREIKTNFVEVSELDYFLLRIFAQILTDKLWLVSHKE